jgi:inosine-uridine nucleoside N-ribohydrolase
MTFATIGLLAVLACTADGARKDVILTTYCGVEVDDQWALAHLGLSPEVNLLAVVTSHAPNLKPPAAETSARSAREVLDHINPRSKPRVIAGSSTPLADKSRPLRNLGVEFLISQAKGHSEKDRLLVLVIGPATDVASALLIDPSLANRIEIVAMAFDDWPDGGDPWNVKNDVKAWQVLLESEAPIVIGGSAVTKRHLTLSPAEARQRFKHGGEAGNYLTSLLTTWLERNADLAQKMIGRKDVWTIWDEVVTAHLLGLTRVETHPRPRLRENCTFDHTNPRGTVEWITAIDSDRLWAEFANKLSAKPSK